ncbi:MAG: amidohydrolase [Gulosibacter sp.]|uniref:amidohydrolase n=1 Tax=Gulosibacter sp. TaxID=2817531 RepID=UPI003F90F297
MTADVIIHAHRVHTLAEEAANATSIAIRGKRILAVGDRSEIGALQGSETVVYEYPNGVITPGLIDSHTHLVWGTELTRGVNLTDLSLAEVAAALAEVAPSIEAGEWLHGWGLDPNIFTDHGFDGRIFDEATGSIPMFLRMRDAHSAIVNSATIALVGLTGDETFPDESAVVTDAEGAVSGYLREISAMNLVLEVAPKLTLEQAAEKVRAQMLAMAATGLTATHVLDLHEGTVEIMEHLEATGSLPMRVRISPFVMPGVSAAGLAELEAMQGRGGRRWQIEGVKFFIDGTVDNGTAWLHAPDCYGQGTESIWTDPEAYREALRFFAERSIPTATHAIGDRGVDFVLDAFESLGELARNAPNRIEHIETIPDSTVPRFARLGIAASMQPVHGTHHTKADRSDNWSVRLGEERAARGWRCQDIRRTGATLALGSDWPVTPFDPRAMMADSILRRPVERPGVAPVQPEQGLTALQALEGYTSHSARSVGVEDEGVLAPGARAQVTVFAADPLEVSAEELAETEVLATFVEGELQYGRSLALMRGVSNVEW